MKYEYEIPAQDYFHFMYFVCELEIVSALNYKAYVMYYIWLLSICIWFVCQNVMQIYMYAYPCTRTHLNIPAYLSCTKT